MPRLTVAILVAVSALLWIPASAAAHARLVASTPASDAALVAMPRSVVLQFDDPVTAGADAIQVYAPDETRVDLGLPTPGEGARVTQRIKTDQRGTFGVAYRVSSDDGHVVSGAITFSVGTATPGARGAADASRDAAHVDRGVQVAFSTARFIEVLALLIAAGGGIFASLIAPGWRAHGVLLAVVVLLAAYGAGFILNAAIIHGTGIAAAFNGHTLEAAAATPLGLSLQIRAIVAVVALAPALLLRQGRVLPLGARIALAAVFVGLAASLSITGHAVTTSPTWLRLPLDMVHVVAAAVWIGGLVQLAAMAPTAFTHVSDITRFSRAAFSCVVVLLLSGLYAAWAELGMHPSELLDSRYGRLVLAKFVIYLGIMPLAANNMRTLVPQVRQRADDAPRMLRQYVWRELILLLAVVALTVWLIATPQPH